MTGVARQAAGCQRHRGVGTGGERARLACWYCAENPVSSLAAEEIYWKSVNTHKWQQWQKVRERAPEQMWEAHLVTSESWECPAWAREASSSAGCWCFPAVVQPCSLSHPRPASYAHREGADGINIMSLNVSNAINRNTTGPQCTCVFCCKHGDHNDFVLQKCFTRGC